MNTPTPRTDAILADDTGDSSLIRYLATLARTLERELEEANKKCDQWKASHDNQVKIKNIIKSRGDLRDRAPKVEKLVAELNQTKTNNAELLEALEACMKIIGPK